MRKRSIIILAISSIFALTSCDLLNNLMPNGPMRRSSKEDSSEVFDGSNGRPSNNPSSSKSSNHRHSYSSWEIIVPPTCTERGVEERRCECGDVQTRDVSALGHSFDIFITSTATCTTDGYDVYGCSRCDARTQIPASASHMWGAFVRYNAPSEEYVGYNVYECVRCNWYQQIEIKATDGTLAAGSSIKNGTPNGFMKLNSTNNSISWKFNFDIPRANGASYHGTLYQRAYMDAFSSNTTKTYSNTSTTSSSVTTEEGNFRVEVNGVAVDKSPYMHITFEEMTANGDDSSWVGENLSPIALCPIGEVYLKNGENEIKYTRLGSFNLIMSDLVMIVEPFNHTHQIASQWSYDENQHWFACTDPHCSDPNYKADVSDHILSGTKYDEITATCTQEGSYKRQCSVCGYMKTVILPKEEHIWYVDDSFDVVQPTRTTLGHQTVRCSVCGETQTIDTSYGQTKETALTVDEALEIGNALEVKEQTEGIYYVKGFISQVVRTQPEYNRVTLWLKSSTNSNGFEFYSVTLSEGVSYDDIVVGAEVLGHGKIHRYKEDTIEFNGKSCYLDSVVKQETVETNLLGSYFGSLIWAGPTEQVFVISITNSLAYMKISNKSYYVSYSYDSSTSELSINTNDDSYGVFTANYRDGALMDGSFNGSLAQSIFNNGTISLSENNLLYDCDGTSEQLQTAFKRRYRPDGGSGWVIDTANADRITSVNDSVMGSCLRIRPYSNGAIALNLAQDLETPLECNSFGFWVYNPSENDIDLRIWMYKSTSHTSSFEIATVTAVAGQWTYCYSVFTALSTYNFQIADFTNSGVGLLFDNISFSMRSSVLNS